MDVIDVSDGPGSSARRVAPSRPCRRIAGAFTLGEGQHRRYRNQPDLLGTAFGIWKENKLDQEVWQVIDKAVSATELQLEYKIVRPEPGPTDNSNVPPRGVVAGPTDCGGSISR